MASCHLLPFKRLPSCFTWPFTDPVLGWSRSCWVLTRHRNTLISTSCPVYVSWSPCFISTLHSYTSFNVQFVSSVVLCVVWFSWLFWILLSSPDHVHWRLHQNALAPRVSSTFAFSPLGPTLAFICRLLFFLLKYPIISWCGFSPWPLHNLSPWQGVYFRRSRRLITPVTYPSEEKWSLPQHIVCSSWLAGISSC